VECNGFRVALIRDFSLFRIHRSSTYSGVLVPYCTWKRSRFCSMETQVAVMAREDERPFETEQYKCRVLALFRKSSRFLCSRITAVSIVSCHGTVPCKNDNTVLYWHGTRAPEKLPVFSAARGWGPCYHHLLHYPASCRRNCPVYVPLSPRKTRIRIRAN